MNAQLNNSLAVGIVYREKATLDWLAIQVDEAQYQVDQWQANVDALTAKSQQFNDFLTAADANKSAALSNLNLAIDVESSVTSLCNSTGLAVKQTDTATNRITLVSRDMATLVNKLIFAVELIEKFGQLVNKQKSNNPLIPDSLIAFMAKATSDANNAVALTLTALQSCYAAEATSLRSLQVITLENDQVTQLQGTINGQSGSPSGADVLALVKQAFEIANEKYNQARTNLAVANKQLAFAQSKLALATTSLSSYQSGLAAATAAAYAA